MLYLGFPGGGCWVAATVAEMKDDDFLMQRHQPGKGGGKDTKKDEEG